MTWKPILWATTSKNSNAEEFAVANLLGNLPVYWVSLSNVTFSQQQQLGWCYRFKIVRVILNSNQTSTMNNTFDAYNEVLRHSSVKNCSFAGGLSILRVETITSFQTHYQWLATGGLKYQSVLFQSKSECIRSSAKTWRHSFNSRRVSSNLINNRSTSLG